MRPLKELLTVVSLLPVLAVSAQDSRTVSEPQFPPACIVLKANLTVAKSIAAGDESKLDTRRMQSGIDACPAGRAVELTSDGPRNAFLSGPLQLKAGVVLLLDKDVTLYASRDPKDYELQPGSCGVVSDASHGCKALINGDNAPGSGIMGDGVIDGRGGSKLLLDGKEQSKTWWDLSEEARAGGHQQDPKLMAIDHSDNFTLYRITLKNSPFFHITYSHGDGFTVWGVKIDTPATARNTDGIDPSASKNITVTKSFIRTGDDNIAIKGGNGPVTNMSVLHNHFYYGHGMSIGSETVAGVSAIRVNDLTLDGTTAGVRIKSQEAYGGLVHDVVYEDLCIRNAKYPIQLDTRYSANPKTGKGLIPVFQDITLRHVQISGGGTIQLSGYDSARPIEIHLDDVQLTDSGANYKFVVSDANASFGPGPVNFLNGGRTQKSSESPAKDAQDLCGKRFVAFPAK